MRLKRLPLSLMALVLACSARPIHVGDDDAGTTAVSTNADSGADGRTRGDDGADEVGPSDDDDGADDDGLDEGFDEGFDDGFDEGGVDEGGVDEGVDDGPSFDVGDPDLGPEPSCQEILQCALPCMLGGIDPACIGDCTAQAGPGQAAATLDLGACVISQCMDSGACSFDNLQSPTCLACTFLRISNPTPAGCEAQAEACSGG